MKNTLIYIYGVNLLNEQISELKSFSDNIKIQNHIVKFDGIQKRINGSGKDAKWKIMMQCQISYVILEAIDFAKKNNIFKIFVSNSDMFLNKSLDNLFEKLNTYDLLLLENDRVLKSLGQIMNGVICFNINKKTEEFFFDYNLMHKDRDVKHFDDQRYLMTSYNKFKNLINIGRISKNLYVNGHANKEAVIWSAHLSHKEKSYEHYENEIIKIYPEFKNYVIFSNDNNIKIKLIKHKFSKIFKKRNYHEVMFRRINTYLIKNKLIDGNIIDLGSWMGDNSIPWAMNLSHTIYAIDPSVNNIKYIEKMAKVNNIINIKTIQKAISDKNEIICTDNKIDHCTFNKKEGKTKIESVSLDYLYSKEYIDNIAYIHLDVEGFESNVINGSKNIIKLFNPIISFEQHVHRDNYKELSLNLFNQGYNIYLINEILPGCNSDCRNLFAFPNNIKIEINKINTSIGKNVLLSVLNWNNCSYNSLFTATLYGNCMSHKIFRNVKSVDYQDKHIFCVNDNNYTKIVVIDTNKNWLCSKYLYGEINILCKNSVINAYLTAQGNMKKKDYNIKDILKFQGCNFNFYNKNIQISKRVIKDVFSNFTDNTKMLIFGLGYDSKMWYNGNKNTYFIEHNDKYINLNTNDIPKQNIIKYEYKNINLENSFQKSNTELSNYKIPEKIKSLSPFDIIIIDGSPGYQLSEPGRLIPYYWSTQLSKKGTIIYGDDCTRKLEKYSITKFFNNKEKIYFKERKGCVKITY